MTAKICGFVKEKLERDGIDILNIPFGSEPEVLAIFLSKYDSNGDLIK